MAGLNDFFKSPESLALRNTRRKDSIARMHAGDGFIYVAEIVGTDIIKIGFSLNPEKRVPKVDCRAWGSRARLLGVIPGTWAQEKALHRALNGHRSRNEYYPRSLFLQVAA